MKKSKLLHHINEQRFDVFTYNRIVSTVSYGTVLLLYPNGEKMKVDANGRHHDEDGLFTSDTGGGGKSPQDMGIAELEERQRKT